MKFERDYNTVYKHVINGYRCVDESGNEKCYINKIARPVGICNEVVDGWEVVENKYSTKRYLYASTLKEAKAYVTEKF